MNTDPDNLPVHAGGSLISYSTPEEYATALKAHHALMDLVAQHNEGNRHAAQEDNEDRRRDDDQFLYGQDFDIEPEVWDSLEEFDDPEGFDLSDL